VENIYFPTDGLTSTRAVLQDGREIECALVGRTNALGTVAALGYRRAPTRFVCLTDGHAWKIALPHLVAAARSLPTVERQLKLFCFAEMGYAIHVGVCNAMHAAEQRLARWLTTAADLLGRTEVRLPQEELAGGLGLQRSAVNLILQRLKAEGLVDMARGRVLILDADRLNRRACECRQTLRRTLCLDDALPGNDMMGSFGPPIAL
jgi:CRP-like cAMP-binding protein